jgi:hypothetical protein
MSIVQIIDGEYYIFDCPHCSATIQVMSTEVNCQIFRHGVIKHSGEPVNPHESKEHCEKLVEMNLAHGCCKPFQLFRGSNGLIEYVEKCDWI